jgi:enoyl-[acyl-carrier protein] reductase I
MNPDEVENFFSLFKRTGLDVLVHGIAFGPETIFTELPSQVNSADFSETLETSVHSLSKIVRFAKPYLNPWASILTLTFQASQRAMPMYGLMGVAKAALESMVRYLAIELGKERIRVNAISAGPVETLAALSEIIAFRRNPEALNHLPTGMIHEIIQQSTSGEDELQFAKKAWEKLQTEFAKRSPIPEILVADDIAQTVLYFASDLSRKVTGQILYVDCGFSACQLI